MGLEASLPRVSTVDCCIVRGVLVVIVVGSCSAEAVDRYLHREPLHTLVKVAATMVLSPGCLHA